MSERTLAQQVSLLRKLVARADAWRERDDGLYELDALARRVQELEAERARALKELAHEKRLRLEFGTYLTSEQADEALARAVLAGGADLVEGGDATLTTDPVDSQPTS